VKYWGTLLRKSSKFFDCVEKAFGKEVSIARSIKTRWNSTCKEAEEFHATAENEGKFDQAIDDYNDRKASAHRLTPQHKEILKELISVLELFVEATLKTEGDKKPSINCVAPLVLGLINAYALQEQLRTVQFCSMLIKALLRSMFSRFNGMLQLVGFKTPNEPYLFSTYFTPNAKPEDW